MILLLKGQNLHTWVIYSFLTHHLDVLTELICASVAKVVIAAAIKLGILKVTLQPPPGVNYNREEGGGGGGGINQGVFTKPPQAEPKMER